jgi:hypothetical protein
VTNRSVVVWIGVVAECPSHGFGELRDSVIAAETGVGSVEAVAAVDAAERGV